MQWWSEYRETKQTQRYNIVWGIKIATMITIKDKFIFDQIGNNHVWIKSFGIMLRNAMIFNHQWNALYQILNKLSWVDVFY